MKQAAGRTHLGTEVGVGLWDLVSGSKAQGQLWGAQVVPCALGLSLFHQHPQSIEVERGGVAHFQCLIREVPEPSISWEHNGTALSTANHR